MDARSAVGVAGTAVSVLRSARILSTMHLRVLRRRIGFTATYLLLPIAISLTVLVVCGSVTKETRVRSSAGISFDSKSGADMDMETLPLDGQGEVVRTTDFDVDPDDLLISRMRGDGLDPRAGHVFFAPSSDAEVVSVMREIASADPGLDYDAHFSAFETIEDMSTAVVKARRNNILSAPVVLIARGAIPGGQTVGRWSVAYYNVSRIYVRPIPDNPFSFVPDSADYNEPSVTQLAYIIGSLGLPPSERVVSGGSLHVGSDLNPSSRVEFSLLVRLLRARVAVVTRAKGLPEITLRARVRAAPVRRVPKQVNEAVRIMREEAESAYYNGYDESDIEYINDTDAMTSIASNLSLFLAIAMFTHSLQFVSFGIEHKSTGELGLLRQSRVSDVTYLLSLIFTFLPIIAASTLFMAAVLMPAPLITTRASFLLIWISLFFADTVALGIALFAVAFFQRSTTSNAFMFFHGLASWAVLFAFSEDDYAYESASYRVLTPHWIIPVLFIVLSPSSLLGAAFSGITYTARRPYFTTMDTLRGSKGDLYPYRRFYSLAAIWGMQLGAFVLWSVAAWCILGVRAGTSKANGAARRHWLSCLGAKPKPASRPGGASGYNDTVGRILRESESGSIVAREIGKVFPGKMATTALRDVSLTVRGDRVTALLGENGSGKTTLLSILAGQAMATSGSLAAFGFDAAEEPAELQARVTICPQEDTALNEHLTPAEILIAHARLRGVHTDRCEEVVAALLAAMHLRKPAIRDARIGTLTGGQRRRVSIALACLGNPKICFFDEPGAPLDPRNRRAVYRFLRDISRDRGVVFTTHLIPDAEWADEVAILGESRLRAHGSPRRLKEMYGAGYILRIVLAPSLRRADAVAVQNALLGAMPSASLLESAFGREADEISTYTPAGTGSAAADDGSPRKIEANSFTVTIPASAARSHIPAALAQVAELRASGFLELWDLSHATLEEVVIRVAAAGKVNAQTHLELERRRAEAAAVREARARVLMARGSTASDPAAGPWNPHNSPLPEALPAPMCKACGERRASTVDIMTLRGIVVRVEGVLCVECGRPPSPSPGTSRRTSRSSSRSHTSPRAPSNVEDDRAGSSCESICKNSDGSSAEAPVSVLPRLTAPMSVAVPTSPSDSSSVEDDGAGSVGGNIVAAPHPLNSVDNGVFGADDGEARPHREAGPPRVMRALLSRAWSRKIKARKTTCVQILVPLIVFVIVSFLVLRAEPHSPRRYWPSWENPFLYSYVNPRFTAFEVIRTVLRARDLDSVRYGNIADKTRVAPGIAGLGRPGLSYKPLPPACEGNSLYQSDVRMSFSPNAGGTDALNTTWLRRFWNHSPMTLFGGWVDKWPCSVRGTGCPECDWAEPANPTRVLRNSDNETDSDWASFRVKTFANVVLSTAAGPAGEGRGAVDADDAAAERRLGDEMLAQQQAASEQPSSRMYRCSSGSVYFESRSKDDCGNYNTEASIPRISVRVRREDANNVDFTVVAPIARTYVLMRVPSRGRGTSRVSLVEDSVYGGLRAVMGVQSPALLQYTYVALLAFLGGHRDSDIRRIYTEQATLSLAEEQYTTRPPEWDTAAELPPLNFWNTPPTETEAYLKHIRDAMKSHESRTDSDFSPHAASSFAIGILLLVALAPLPSMATQAASEMEGHVADMIRLAGVTTKAYWTAHHIFWFLFSLISLVPLVVLCYGFDIPPFGAGWETIYTGTAGAVPVFILLAHTHAQSGFSAFLAAVLGSRQRASVTSMLLVPFSIAYAVVLNVASRGAIPWWTTVLPPFALARGIHEVYSSPQPDLDAGAWISAFVLFVEGFTYLGIAAFVSSVRRTARDAGIESSEAIAEVVGGKVGRCAGAAWHALGVPLRSIVRWISPDKPAPFNNAAHVSLIDDDCGDRDGSRSAAGGPEVDAEAVRANASLSQVGGVPDAAILFNVCKTFEPSGKRALSGVTLGVRRGEVLGLLGPNGAGKSTIVKILTRALRPDGCMHTRPRAPDAVASTLLTGNVGPKVVVDGVDVLGGDPVELYHKIGIQPQHNAVWEDLTVEENILFYVRVKGVPRRLEKIATLDAASEVGLSGHEFTKPTATLSGGQKRMLTLAFALVGSPSLLILDEPTAAISVNGRHRAWEVISSAAKGRSALVLTHIMEEASALANRVAILSRGELIRIGKPLELQNRFCSGFKLSLQPRRGAEFRDLAAAEQAVASIVARVAPEARPMESCSSKVEYFVPLPSGVSSSETSSTVNAILNAITTDPRGQEVIEEWSVSQPTLEDVFLRVIGDSEDDHH